MGLAPIEKKINKKSVKMTWTQMRTFREPPMVVGETKAL